jgi:hypothetical protein
MPFTRLCLHPSSAAAPAIAIEAVAVALRAGAVSFRYRVHGDVARIRLPPTGSSARTDELWRHTCFEAFVGSKSSGRYVELNFAPSTAWAAYTFDGYRLGLQRLDMGAPTIDCRVADGSIALEATVQMPFTAPDSAIGLAAVIEDVAGMIGYWALTHPRAKPDFHAAAGWTGELEGPHIGERE